MPPCLKWLVSGYDHTVTKLGRALLRTHTCYSLQTTWTTSRRWQALRLWALEETMMALQSKSDILFYVDMC